MRGCHYQSRTERENDMSRLIDADEFQKQIVGMAILNNYPPDKANALCKLVDSQPTAFDVDSVVNELKREKFIESETVLLDIHQGYNAGSDRAIEIVKRGGRDEK